MKIFTKIRKNGNLRTDFLDTARLQSRKSCLEAAMRVCFGLPIVEGAHVDPVLVLDPIGVAGFEDPSNGIIKELPGSFDVHGRKDAGGGVVD